MEEAALGPDPDAVTDEYEPGEGDDLEGVQDPVGVPKPFSRTSLSEVAGLTSQASEAVAELRRGLLGLRPRMNTREFDYDLQTMRTQLQGMEHLLSQLRDVPTSSRRSSPTSDVHNVSGRNT